LKRKTGNKTNLAPEFFVLSMFFRFSVNTALTIGNKKIVDIILVNENWTLPAFDVKKLGKR
jgi:hypothetical protein